MKTEQSRGSLQYVWSAINKIDISESEISEIHNHVFLIAKLFLRLETRRYKYHCMELDQKERQLAPLFFLLGSKESITLPDFLNFMSGFLSFLRIPSVDVRNYISTLEEFHSTISYLNSNGALGNPININPFLWLLVDLMLDQHSCLAFLPNIFQVLKDINSEPNKLRFLMDEQEEDCNSNEIAQVKNALKTVAKSVFGSNLNSSCFYPPMGSASSSSSADRRVSQFSIQPNG
ncbi:MAG: hypothetical protein V4496_01125 [Pseudomonadota bacterium]